MTFIPPIVQTWISAGIFPQRVLLSGQGDNLELAILIAAQLQKKSAEKIREGAEADTIVFRDGGKSFKVSYSDAARKDSQGEYENSRGLVDWATKKPVAPYRIVILENIERAGISAINALLKLIEEPPTKTIFLITTKNHHKLLDTIISRVTVVRIPKENNDFSLSDEVQDFLRGKNLLKSFQTIEQLDKAAKNNPEKKINRQVILDFLEDCIQHARLFDHTQKHLPLLLETHQSISQNLNLRFTLERLAVKLQQD